ncbi:ABC transporter permease [Haliangium sp.]|uniref:ABC transporter permease n=1 Tax=Haliangium sp. TaxID=2663208 RepID=UPI003D14BA52
MLLPWFLAIRFLREGRMQSALIIAGAGVGVAVIVFLSALINGLQASLVDRTLGTQAHIVIRPPDERARPLMAARASADTAVLSRVEKPAQRIRSIDGWQRLVRELDATPGVTAVSPTITGPAFAVRGNAQRSVAVLGVAPGRFERVIPIADDLVAGRWHITATTAVIGVELADDLGATVGDKIRVQAAAGRSQLFTVSGVFDLGMRDINRRWVIVSPRSAQTLLDLVGGVSLIELRVAEIFAAEDLARTLERRTGLVVESWMKTNAELLSALRAQSSSSTLIKVFVIIAVAIGIASVLVVSVVQKSREIGILRAMGSSRRAILATFLVQGGIVGGLGAVLGIASGAGLARLFENMARNPDGSALFPVDLNPRLFLIAAVIAVVTGVAAAALPARRAARLDPADAIRYE